MHAACGIDFGTSNSTVGCHHQNQTRLLPLENEKVTLPSVVFFNAEEDHIAYGRAALDEYLTGYEGRLMRSLKSLLGSNLIEGQTEVAGRPLPFRMLLTHFISELKKRAEHSAQHNFDSVVLGRPVFFVDDNSEADQLAETTLAEIARSVGFKHIHFQYEPIAAAFAYEASIEKEELVLIVDIGGGTSDFSLLKLSPQGIHRHERKNDILASGGVHIGGTDFDKHLSLTHVMPYFGMGSHLKNKLEMPSSHYFNLATWHTINRLYSPKTLYELKDLHNQAAEKDKIKRLLRLVEERAGHWLAVQTEACKITLSEHQQAQLNLARIDSAITLTIQQDEFHTVLAPLLHSIEHAIHQLLQEAQLTHRDIDTIFFTGGASGVPILKNQITAHFPSAKRVDGDQFGSVGTGLALEAKRIFN